MSRIDTGGPDRPSRLSYIRTNTFRGIDMKRSEEIIRQIKHELENIRGRDNKTKYLQNYMIKIIYHGAIPENGPLPEYDRLDDCDYETKDEIQRWIKDIIGDADKFDSHPLPAEIESALQKLLANNILISYNGKPNFKNLTVAIALFDLWHDKYDIPDYNYKILADNILVKDKPPTQTNINTTRSRGRGIEKQKLKIISILPELK